jgi:hypothetical protein
MGQPIGLPEISFSFKQLKKNKKISIMATNDGKLIQPQYVNL